jgi:hypothetical protein
LAAAARDSRSAARRRCLQGQCGPEPEDGHPSAWVVLWVAGVQSPPKGLRKQGISS